MKFILIFICTSFLWVGSNAQAGSAAASQVVFFRNNAFIDYKLNKVFMDGVFLCKLAEHRYFVKDVPAGKHSFSVQFNGKKSKKKAEKLLIDIQPGKSYYVEVIFQDKWPIPNVYCIEVAESSAMRILPSLKLSTRCEEDN